MRCPENAEVESKETFAQRDRLANCSIWFSSLASAHYRTDAPGLSSPSNTSGPRR